MKILFFSNKYELGRKKKPVIKENAPFLYNTDYKQNLWQISSRIWQRGQSDPSPNVDTEPKKRKVVFDQTDGHFNEGMS